VTPSAGGSADDRWVIRSEETLTIGLANDQSGITVSQADISGRLLTLSWTGRAVEIRAASDIRPVVDGQSVVQAQLRVGQRFSIADNVFDVSGPAQIALVQRQIASPVAATRSGLTTPPMYSPLLSRW